MSDVSIRDQITALVAGTPSERYWRDAQERGRIRRAEIASLTAAFESVESVEDEVESVPDASEILFENADPLKARGPERAVTGFFGGAVADGAQFVDGGADVVHDSSPSGVGSTVGPVDASKDTVGDAADTSPPSGGVSAAPSPPSTSNPLGI